MMKQYIFGIVVLSLICLSVSLTKEEDCEGMLNIQLSVPEHFELN